MLGGDDDDFDPQRVLVIDEAGSMHETHARVLEAYGFTCVVATSLEAARDHALAWLPALVVIDLGVEHPDGVEVAIELRTHYRQRCPPLVLVADGRLALPAPRQLLFDAIFTKPYAVDRFGQWARQLAREHEERRLAPSRVSFEPSLHLPKRDTDEL